MPRDNYAKRTETSGPAVAALSLACLDVDTDGRILSLDKAAIHFLGGVHEGQDCRSSEVFSVLSAEEVDHALRTAGNGDAPRPSICKPDGDDQCDVLQINFLPFEKGRVRIVLFLDQKEVVGPDPEKPHLTPREIAVLRLAASGLRRDRIGFELNISLPTVDMHFRNLRQKLSAVTISEAVATAMRLHLLDA